ncbi:hypothetical protein BCR36DRAFT_580661 [Piromyces finnis]|uniref:Peptidase M20 dimerisation domain-containing protein n=1 Tax=Piromyces finnis TaxID=1754191 RepID=A0A1Y1VIL2_9FUNG|nr:hypothetical protein BCR36DRAFT_580661 [Piromyces finnis]|eukprot:ORX57246.1 hypothetical protein BCR36DRAFT_580661 [Piromyces finnis]
MTTKIDYDTLAKKYYDEYLETLKKLIAIPSVYDEATVSDEHPFGENVTKALNFMVDLAKKDDFQVKNYDNKVVEIIIGDYEENVTLLGHTDVVPAGATGWEYDPFTLTEVDGGVLRARGVSDDKGPMLASYYSLKLLKENNLLGKYQVRLLVGGNEESGSACMHHYFQTLKMKQPTYGFSPDADFPLIYGEKGIINYEVKGNFDLKNIHSIIGGVAFNSVIEKCTVNLDSDPKFVEYLKQNNVKFEMEENGDTTDIIFIGKAAHGSTPEQGINAAMVAVNNLAKFYNNAELHKICEMYNDPYGKGINAYNESKDMGKNSMNLGIFHYENKHLSLIVNFRHVDGVNPESVINNIKEANKPYEIEVSSINKLLFYPLDSTLVSTLLNVYQEETGDYESKPLAIGGGTYAKDADNIVAFGLTFPGVEPHMHDPQENIKKDDLFKGISIYAHAIVALGNKIEEEKK